MTILIAVLANPSEPILPINEGAYNWSRDHCEGDTFYPEQITICASCVVVEFKEGESFLLPMHRIQEIQWEIGDTVFYK